MIERGPLFGTPTFRWIPAAATVEVEYWGAPPGLQPPDALAGPIVSRTGYTKRVKGIAIR